MSTTKFEVEKFTGHNDFRLWRLKMKAILMQYKAYSTLILNLSDRVLREVAKEDTTSGLSWKGYT